jgi:hypothetical protein
MLPVPTRIAVKVSARQDRAHITRFYPGSRIGTTRRYKLTPSSQRRLQRLLSGRGYYRTEGGSWRAEILPGQFTQPEPPACAACGAYILDPAYLWPAETAGDVVCQECWERQCDKTWWEVVPPLAAALALKRARHTHPIWDRDHDRQLRESRMRSGAVGITGGYFGLRPRPRTLARLSRGTMHFLAARRAAAAQCRRRGFERVRNGIWYDRAGDVVYIQTCTIAPAEILRRAVA